MSSPFAPDYLLFTFFSAVGVLQMVFAYHQLRGVLFIRWSTHASGLIGAVMMISAFIWFFASERRNVSDHIGGMDGNAQMFAFTVSAVGAVAFTFLLSSVINYRWGLAAKDVPSGITGLRQTTYVQAVAPTFVNLWRHFRAWIAR